MTHKRALVPGLIAADQQLMVPIQLKLRQSTCDLHQFCNAAFD